MKLYFLCPEKGQTFGADDYALDQGHNIATNKGGGRKLHGTVTLTSGCPFCGEKHSYPVEDVLCPLSGGNDGS